MYCLREAIAKFKTDVREQNNMQKMSCNVSEKHDPQSDRSCITSGSNVLFRNVWYEAERFKIKSLSL